MKFFQNIFSCVIVLHFPDCDPTKEIRLCLFGFKMTADFGNSKHALLHTHDHKLKE